VFRLRGNFAGYPPSQTYNSGEEFTVMPEKRPLPPKKLRDFRGGSPKILPDHDSKKGFSTPPRKGGNCAKSDYPEGGFRFFRRPAHKKGDYEN
jgi:hypothetical protein